MVFGHQHQFVLVNRLPIENDEGSHLSGRLVDDKLARLKDVLVVDAEKVTDPPVLLADVVVAGIDLSED